jgi:MFS family permease
VPAFPSALIEPIAPARLGRDFRWVFGAATSENIGDGILLAAGPLLVASQTSDALLISMAVFVQYLPKLLFGVLAGVMADRSDRRLILIWVDLVRVAVLLVLAGTIVTGVVSIGVILVMLFVLATSETFADTAASSLLPRLVERKDLGIANARLQSSFLLTNRLLAPPIGAFLFVVGMAVPFAANAACFTLSVVLLSRLRAKSPGTGEGSGSPARGLGAIRDEMVEGIRWLVAHPPMRTLVITIIAFNVTFGAAWGVLVLYSREQLAMSEVGFGLITTAMAIGGLIGTTSYGRLERALSLGNIMRIGLVIETFTHLILALTTSAPVALAVMMVFGAHAFVWGTTATSIRQRAVPDAYLGRVTGVYTVGVFAGMVVGTPIGGLLARELGITAPFWFGFVGSAVLVTLLWREFDHIAHSGDVRPEAAHA